MPEQPRKRFTIDSYAGLITTVNPHFIPPNACQQVSNIDFYEKGTLACRKGILPVYPCNSIAPTAFQPISSFGYRRGYGYFLLYETSDGALHASMNPSTTNPCSGTIDVGAPVLRSGFNPFEPLCMMKVQDGFAIGVNGLDAGLFWDGINPTGFNLGMPAPLQAPTVSNEGGVSGNASEGTYQCFVRFLDRYGTPSNLSPAATVVANQGDAFDWTNIPTDQNPRTTQRELWRTTVNEGVTFYLAAVISDNVTTSYLDTLSDAALEQQAANDPYYSMAFSVAGRPNANRFGVPPTWKKCVAWLQDRAFYFADISYTQGTISVVNGSPLIYGNGVAWTAQMAGLYLDVEGAAMPYLISSVSQTSAEVVELNAGGGSTNAVQLVTINSSVTSGTFTLTLSGHTTSGIAYNAPATGAGSVQSAIAALANVGTGNVSVAGSASVGWTVTFDGSLAGVTEPAMTANSSGLSGFGITVTELQSGSASGTGNAQQLIGFDCDGGVIEGGEFTVTFNGHTTPPLPALGYTASQMQTTLQALASIGSGNCTVTQNTQSDTSQSWLVTFTGKLGGINVPQMSIQTSITGTSSGVVYTGALQPYVFVYVIGAS
ncbi:MAG: hypothetical protein KGL39_52025, partial [Patescibacteria group bacterium]|nr:hypothetical protein [Patescibacteria group bacterium]